MSLEAEAAEASAAPPVADATTPQGQVVAGSGTAPAVDPAFAAALDDADFMEELANDIGVAPEKKNDGDGPAS
jgi:hypothetical protein